MVSTCECAMFHFSVEICGVVVLVMVKFLEKVWDVVSGVSSYQVVER